MEEEDFSKLSVEDRCVHKVWKARLSGYEAAATLFRQIDDEKSPEWNKYINLIKKFVIDSNVPAQEKGLEATLAFVENCASAGKTVTDVMSGLVQKCVGSPKARLKDLSCQIILMYIEIEKHEIVLDELIKGTENKNPKIVAACTHLLFVGLQEFGAKVINVGKIVKKVPILLCDKDVSVREEAKALTVLLYRWMGAPAVKAQLTNLKPGPIADVDGEYEKVKDTPLRPTRLLRSQQMKKMQANDTSPHQEGNNEAEIESATVEVDPYEFLDPVDILSALPKNFYTAIEAKKWSERKEVLDVLEKSLSAAPKIENGDYGDLVKALKKIILKDSNVVVVCVAIKCVTGIANGLKKKFHPFSSMMMSCLFEKFKEKKQNVVLALRDAVDAVYVSTNLELILEDVITFLDNKNPSVKSEVVSFVARVFAKSTPTILNKKLLKPLTRALVKSLADQDQFVRENAYQALGTAMKVTGEKTISPFLNDVEPQKMTKIKEWCDKAEILAKPQQKVVNDRTESTTSKNRSNTSERQTPSSSPPSPKTVSTVKLSSAPQRLVAIPDKDLLQRDQAIQKAMEIIPEDIRDDLNNPSKVISAYRRLKEFADSQRETPFLDQILLYYLYTDEIKAANVSTEIMAARINIIKRIFELSSVPEAMLGDVVLEIGNCFSNKELITEASSTLAFLSDTFSINSVSKQLLIGCDNPQLWAEKLNWISNAVIKSKSMVDTGYLMECAKKALSHNDALVRNAALALIGTIHIHADSDAGSTHSGLETSPVHSGAIAKPVVHQELSSKRNHADKGSTSDLSYGGLIKEKSTDDIARVDLGSKFTEQLISDLGDKSWKMRAEAVNKIQALVKDNKQITSNLGEAPLLLAARISDSNSKIAVASINLVESLAVAMGPQCKQHTRTFLPPLIKLIGDPKVWIRSAVITCLNTWYETGGHKEFFEGEVLADALKTGSPSLRSELWNFLALKLPNITPRSLPKEELLACLPVLYQNLEDRNADVRKNACEAVLGFMIHLGFNAMNSACDTIKQGSGGAQVKLILEKTRGTMPEKYLPQAKPKSAPGSQNAARLSTIKMTAGSSATITKSSSKIKGLSKCQSSIRVGKKEEDVDTGALLQVNNLKNQRILDDHKMKTLKWVFTTPRQEFVDLLKELMLAANVNKNLIANMFHSDFRYHLRAIDALSEDLSTNDLSPLISNLDLILRWMTLRFFDTNPSVLVKGLDYLNTAFRMLIIAGYQMLDYEALSFVPYLILKIGDPKDTVRNSVRALFKHLSNVIPATKLFAFVIEGIKSKNARQRSECLDHLAWLIETYGMMVCQPTSSSAIKEIARHIADRDTTVRNAALNCVVTAYFLEGEKVLKMVGQIADKDMSLLEERIKRASKNRPVASVKPLQAATTPPLPEVEELSSVVDVTQESQHSVMEYMETTITVQSEETTVSSPSASRRSINITGPFALDQQLIDEIETEPTVVQVSQVNDIDIEFLKEPIVIPSFQPMQMSSITPTLASYSQKNAVKWEIIQIASSDLEKAVDSMGQIDTLLNSDKRGHLVGLIDLMVNQLVHQLVVLNQSSVPDVVTCYKANFSLLMKVTNYPELCAEISENTLYKLLDRLILLLVERRLQGLDRHEMFVRTINSLILKCMDQSNKTNVLCALLKLLYDTVNSPTAVTMYKDLVAKCLWKSNRAQIEWDTQLDYSKVLIRINTFFMDYPSSWWKAQDNDVPLRTVKTILHTMVKLRGIQVQEIAKTVSGISQDGELYTYIKRLVRHLSHSSDSPNPGTKDTSQDTLFSDSSLTVASSPKLSKEIRDQLSEIFKMIGDTEGTSEGMKRLFAFTKSHPEADITPFLAKSTPVFQQYIERGLAALEQQYECSSPQRVTQQTIKKGGTPQNVSTSGGHITLTSDNTDENTEIDETNSIYFKREAERLWNRLQFLKERAGLPADNRTVDDLCDYRESKEELLRKPETTEKTTAALPNVKSIKERLHIIKQNYN